LNLRRIAMIIALILFLFAVCSAFMIQVRDPDLFWHLATGRWIAEHKALPELDPFAYTTSLKAQEEFYRSKIILTQYWAANVIQYGIHLLGGFQGIIVFRALVVVAVLLVTSVHMRKRGLNGSTTLLLMFPLLYVLFYFNGDRPNQLSFLMAALFMYLADAARKGEKKGYLLPPVYILWANLHGGFILGGIMAAVHLISELAKKIFVKGHELNRGLIYLMAATIAAGVINPNGYNIIYSMFYEMSEIHNAYIMEHISPLSHAANGTYLFIGMIIMSMLLAIIHIAFQTYSSRQEPGRIFLMTDEILLTALFGYLAFTSIRYIPFLAIAIFPVTSPTIGQLSRRPAEYLSRFMVPELLTASVSSLLVLGLLPGTIFRQQSVSPYYPDDAVDFIKQANMEGRFFNFYDWGGYLIWEFYPKPFVFIDGRSISILTAHASEGIISDSDNLIMNKPFYRAMFESYSVRNVLVPAIDVEGNMVPLIKRMVDDPDWSLVFVGRNSLIFSRDMKEPSFPKMMSYSLALTNITEFLSNNPDSIKGHLTFAKATSYLGRTNNAVSELEKALKERPGLRGGPAESALQLLKEGKEIPIKM